MAKTRGLGRVYQRGKLWWIQYYHRGELHREASGSEVRAKAVSLLKKRHAEMGQGRLVGPDVERTTFDDLAAMLSDDYRVNSRKSLDRAQRAVYHLRQFFGRDRAVDITPDRVSAYIRSRLESAKAATIRNELAALGRMFTLAVRAGKAAYRPQFPSIEVRNTRVGFFETDELQAVLEELPEDLRALITFTHLTGWRIGEVKRLTWRHVDFAAGTVRLDPGTTKNDEGRMFPFAALPELEALLSAQRARTSALQRERGQLIPWVFHRSGKRICDFSAAWRAARARAGVAGRIVHDLRRTAVRNLERAGVPRSWAMKLTGHKTESVYRRYAIVSEADLSEGVRKLAALSARPESRRVASLTAAANSRTSTERAQFEANRD